MLEILVIMAIVLILMARKTPRRRAMGRYIRGQIDLSFALGTLASATLVSGSVGSTVNERTLVSSIVVQASLAGYTVTDNVGPILIGVAHSDYTDAEIEAFVEVAASWNETNMTDREIMSRKVRKLGIIDPDGGGLGGNNVYERPTKSKLNWILTQGQTLKFWAYNMGGVAVGTTDPNLHVQGHANLFPK